MSGEVPVTIIGTTTAPGELRFTAAGHAVCSFTVAVNPRRYDKTSQQWKEQPTQWYRCSAWRDLAEHCAETLADKGARVIVTGTLNPREWEDKDGAKRLSLEVDVEEVGVSLRFATAAIHKASRDGGGFAQSSSSQQSADDPWATSSSSGGGAPF